MSNNPAESRAAFAVLQERDGGQDILDIGEQCSARTCGLVDFLPFKCDHCKERFCQEHYRPEYHECAKWDKNAEDRRAIECPFCSTLIAIPPGEDPNIRVGRHIDEECVVMTGKAVKKSSTPVCSRIRCEKRLWQPIECEKCHQQFCATHRHPTSHSCSSASAPSSVNTNQGQLNSLANFQSQASAKSAAAMAAVKRSLAASSSNNSASARPAPQRAPTLLASSSSSPGTSALTTASAGPNKVKTAFSSKDRRAIAERKSQLRAMEERQRKGLLSQADEERLKALQESIKDDSDCVVM
ncbi:hypothetical protein DFH11DRAFT_1688819 [Phellopilus nigrolimitatus]|nr:hypothetical protein DFH11DRAFT_1688819 [Phellopilus nigrolimitatus]